VPPDEANHEHHRLNAFAQARRQFGFTRELSRRAVREARIKSIVLLPVLAGVLLLYKYRSDLLGPDWDTTVRVLTAAALLPLSWELARDIGRSLGPQLLQRMDPGTAGTVGFLIRLATMLVAAVVALRIAGLTPRTLAFGGALTAVVVGLAAQQTLGNLLAGTVLLSARPFHVGERVKLQGGPLAGSVEGVVSALGLLYTTLARGDDLIMVPNAVVLNSAVVPLREPTGVHLRARLRPGITPVDVESHLRDAVATPMRGAPRITLEEIDGDQLVVHIEATPKSPADGPRLANEVLAAIAPLTAPPTVRYRLIRSEDGLPRDSADDEPGAERGSPT
jgi:small conductance mechanosensitive channel